MVLKTPEEIEIMAEGGRRLGAVLEALRGEVRVGVTTRELDRRAEELIRMGGDAPAFKNYLPDGADRPYPATLCTSVNDGVVHGLPSDRMLEEGDVLKLDLGLLHGGLYVDAAITVPVGRVSDDAWRLVRATEAALNAGISQARAGRTLGDIGAAVQRVVERDGFSVVTALTGHGIGRELHEDPSVLNVGKPGAGDVLVAGMVIAIEPMTALGKARVKQLKDDSFVTADGSTAAHFEHTVAITKGGPRVLTRG
jgi:methionyl aminopeptidase